MDCHGVVRTVTVGFKKRDVREPTLPYIPKVLQELELGIQRIAVVCPVEDQVGEDASNGTNVATINGEEDVGVDDLVNAGARNVIDVGARNVAQDGARDVRDDDERDAATDDGAGVTVDVRDGDDLPVR